MGEINFSFIIPHKNCPDLLQRCVNSIPEKNDIEIVVVDDNSDDGRKPDLQSRKGLEVILLNAKQSKGAGRARNVGMNCSRGKWFLFADADDYFFEDKLARLLNKYSNIEDVDVVYLNALSYIGNSKELSEFQPRINKIFQQKEKLSDNKFEELIRFETWEPWTRMCKREFVIKNNIRFDEIPRQNDLSFGIKVSIFSRKWCIEESKTYCWIEWPKTVSREVINWSSFEDLLNIRYDLNTLYRKFNFKRRECFLYYIYLSFKWMGVGKTFTKTLPYIIKHKINPFSGLFFFIANKY